MTTDALNSPPVGPGSVGPVSVGQCWVRCLTLAMSPGTLWEETLPGKGNLGIHLVSGSDGPLSPPRSSLSCVKP